MNANKRERSMSEKYVKKIKEYFVKKEKANEPNTKSGSKKS